MVVRASDGAPLKKAEISLFHVGEGGRPAGTITGEDGRFRFQNLEPGEYQLSASRNGYVRAQYGQAAPNMPGTPITVNPGQAVNDVVLRMTPGAVVTGRVVDEDGEAMAGVRVRVLRWSYRGGVRQLFTVGSSTTDDLGDYRVAGLAPGRYLVGAAYARFGRFGRRNFDNEMFSGEGNDAPQDEQRYAPVFYPNVTDAEQASAVAARAGEEVASINFRLLPESAAHVRGILRSATGEPMGEVMVNLRSTGFEGMRRGDSTDKNGAFDISGVTPGSYVLEVMYAGQWLRQEVQVGNSDVEVAANMQPAVELRGQIRLVNGADISGRTPRVMLSPRMAGERGAGAPVQKDLTFKAGEVPGGEYSVSVGGLPEDAYLKSVRAGDLDVLQNGLRIQGRVSPLEIVVSGAGGHVEGAVVDDRNQAVTGARVILVPGERGRYDLYKTASSDTSGRFLLRGITPGSYKLFAFAAVDEGAWLDPDFIAAYEDFGTSVSVGEAAHLTQDLRAIPGMRAAQ